MSEKKSEAEILKEQLFMKNEHSAKVIDEAELCTYCWNGKE